ncbi:MAG: helicase-related protein [Gemmatimonadaceae bacterium]
MSELRSSIIAMLGDELVGPSRQLPALQTGLHAQELKSEEMLRAEDPPRVRYGAGILFPGGTRVQTQDELGEDTTPDQARDSSDVTEAAEAAPDVSASGGAGDTETATDLEVNRANEYLPSALGVTALIRVPDVLTVEVSAALYEREDHVPGRGWTRKDGSAANDHLWRRQPVSDRIEFRSADLLAGSQAVLEEPVRGAQGLFVHVFVRRSQVGSGHADERIITVTLINRRISAGERAADEDCFYQCGIRVQGPDGCECILEYPEIAPSPADDPEELSLRLLYRHRKAYAVGHGCAALWPESESFAVAWICSDTLPVHEIRPIVPSDLPGLELSMLRFSESEGMHASALAQRLASAYRDWISEQERALAHEMDLDPALRETGERHLRECRTCLTRIEGGAELLASDVRARRAFAMMNRAMLLQQAHYRLSSQQVRRWVSAAGARGALEPERPYAAPNEVDPERRWRPFQLAFILMNLRSMADPRGDERQVVDVIWFPTGGGKTEAYLGLAAFTVLLRRLRNPANAGTTILMRYTLRLLTTQQFQRAASLICALEVLRRENPGELGTEEISIGLWVGGTVTPNSEDDAVNRLRALQRTSDDNPFVLRSCPWCGVEMGPVKHGQTTRVKGYRELPNPRRVRFVCDDAGCAFSNGEGLPVQVIDQHLYASPPTLVIGTVDKFALIPWTPDARALFGLGTRRSYSPPELIIQDELHLISGPLGSMVGHYETLIDVLCREASGAPAKIVASTATIARALEQIRNLYGRETAQLFPPQALRAGESFFAREARDRPGRSYVGVFASGLPSQVTTQVRVLALLLQAPMSLTADDPSRDLYWTLMVYFNSIRELGHAATLVRADIVEYMAVMWERLGLSKGYRTPGTPDRRRFINTDLELTSRVSSSEVTDVMASLFTPTGRSENRAVDICLATNMVQVGLDVPRLNLMAIVGQPKTASEYIQASSRVGRDMPGLVVTILNPGKPRDRSHYEHFHAFHQSIYRFVEPTSVTPFALPVRERALHALVVALVRLWGGESIRRSPDPAPDDALVRRIRAAILDRVRFVDEQEMAAAGAAIDAFVDEWRRVPPTRYGGFGQPQLDVPLMYPAGSQQLPDWDSRAWATPSSMRNVDATCNAQPVSSYPGV